MSKIKVTACDNEIIGIVSNQETNESFILFDIKSGFNNPVSVEINLIEGSYKGIQVYNGTARSLNETDNINVPQSNVKTPYELSLIGIDWGGAANFSGNVDGIDFNFNLNPSHDGLITDLAHQKIKIQ
jgi:hypothetical protein